MIMMKNMPMKKTNMMKVNKEEKDNDEEDDNKETENEERGGGEPCPHDRRLLDVLGPDPGTPISHGQEVLERTL